MYLYTCAATYTVCGRSFSVSAASSASQALVRAPDRVSARGVRYPVRASANRRSSAVLGLGCICRPVSFFLLSHFSSSPSCFLLLHPHQLRQGCFSRLPSWLFLSPASSRLWSRAPARIPGSMKHDLDRDPLGARGCSSALLACFLSPAPCALLRGLCGLFDSFDSARILSLARGLCWDPPILFCRATGHDTFSRVGSGPSVVYLHGPASTGSRLLAPPLPASVNLTRVNE
ncbi:hypothetical protein V8C26DRAFT_409435 [Trichoderma gracile]